jgi:hypothetical protein
MTVILEAIKAWLNGAAINPLMYPRRCRQAIHAQNRIGWYAFLQGYWTPEWSLLQDAHLKSTKIWTHQCNGQSWASHNITTIWNNIHQAWTLHNDALHTRDAKFEDHDLKKRTKFRIIRLHQRRCETMAIHSDYFLEDPDAILLVTSPNFQRNWLNLYEADILESIQMAQADSIKLTQRLSTYFPITRAGDGRGLRNYFGDPVS